MALRHLLLLFGFLLAIQVIGHKKEILFEKESWPVAVTSGFFLWLLFHFVFLATNMEEQLNELQGDWLRTFIASLIGIALGLVVNQTSNDSIKKSHENIFIAGLAGTIIIYLMRYVWEIQKTDKWIHHDFYMEPYLGKTPLVVFGSIFLCGILAKISTKLSHKEAIIWNPLAAVAFISVGVTYYFSNTKNGFLVFIFILAIYAWRVFWNRTRSSRSAKFAFLFALLALLVILKSHIEVNPSWLNFYADVKTGIDLEKNQNWKNASEYPLPINAKGITANGSTYERSAWATAGTILVKENPLGYGLINHSFGALALQKWDDFYKPVGKYRRASHSGWLDFTLGFGIPGLILVLVPMWVSYFRAARRPSFWFEFVRWSVPVITVVFTITEVCTGHFIEFLFFYVALISAITIKRKKTLNVASDAETASYS